MDPDGKSISKFAKYALLPLIYFNKTVSRILKKILKEEYGDVTEESIRSMVDAGNESGIFEETSAEMINNVFEFEDLKVADVMTHRVNIVAVEEKTSLDYIIYLALEKGFSRIPVYNASIDNITGIIIVKDLLSLIGKDNYEKFNIHDFIRKALFIPNSSSCADAFKFLTGRKTALAIVVDEYGGTAGLITLENLIEAVMGNIQDEYDEEGTEITPIGKDKYEIVGTASPEDVLELFGHELPEDHEYDTIAGFVTDLLGYIPSSSYNSETRPHVDYKDVRFIVRETEDNCINKIIAIRHVDTAYKTDKVNKTDKR